MPYGPNGMCETRTKGSCTRDNTGLDERLDEPRQGAVRGQVHRTRRRIASQQDFAASMPATGGALIAVPRTPG